MKKFLFVFVLFSTALFAQHKQLDVRNPKNLKDVTKVKNYLISIGFKEVKIQTSDNKKLEGMFLHKTNADYSMVVQGGWAPGHYKGMTTFQKMLENENCNILFLNGRGRGNSCPLSIKDELLYGIKQPKDIMGALQFMHEKADKKPIITLNICASAFNAAHAVLALQKETKQDKPKVVGMVFDSGWTSVNKASQSVVDGKYSDWLVKKIAALKGIAVSITDHKNPTQRETVYKNREKIRRSFLHRLFFFPIIFVYKIIHTVFGKLWYWPFFEHKTTLQGKMKNLKTNIMFVHSEHDSDVPIEHIKQLSEEVSQDKKTEYFVKNAKHACIQFVYFDEYKGKLLQFINKCVHKKNN